MAAPTDALVRNGLDRQSGDGISAMYQRAAASLLRLKAGAGGGRR
jgi:hypothetical protein